MYLPILGRSFVQTATHSFKVPRLNWTDWAVGGQASARATTAVRFAASYDRALIALDATPNATAGFASAKWLRDGGRCQLAASANEELWQVTRRQVV